MIERAPQDMMFDDHRTHNWIKDVPYEDFHDRHQTEVGAGGSSVDQINDSEPTRSLTEIESEMTALTDGFRDPYNTVVYAYCEDRVEDAYKWIEAGKTNETAVVPTYGTEPQYLHPAAHHIVRLDEKHKPAIKTHAQENLGAYQELAAIDAYKSGVDLNIANPLHPNSKNNKPVDFDASALRFWTGGTATGLIGIKLLEMDPVEVLPVSVVVGIGWAIKNYRNQQS